MYGTPVTNERGATIAAGTVGPDNPGGADPRGGTLRNVTVTPSGQLVEQSLPVDPMGVVYDSVSRNPVAGATVVLEGPVGFDADAHLLGGAANLEQVTGEDGLYQFLLVGTAPAGTYTSKVGRRRPVDTHRANVTHSFVRRCMLVGPLPNPALMQASSLAPAATVPNVGGDCPANSAGHGATANTTQYFLSFQIDPTNSGNVLNNHVPVDPILGGALVITKTTPMVNVTRGDLVLTRSL